MPASKSTTPSPSDNPGRRGRSSAAPAKTSRKGEAGIKEPSPRWWAPLMVTLMIVGLIWVVVFYLSQTAYPIPDLGYWNLGIGFGLMLIGFAMTTNWR
ncbi:cell division protein CrgA [Arsenicicoccus dermatophilus]|uniref:cell division protein CrgA n=1 Tax=Arsenicicoccus dermatophilus TaxID=1076331 RepID=UPI003916E812